MQRESPSLTYRDAVGQILRVTSDPDNSKLTPARREMNALLRDRAKCQRLAGDAINRLARQRLTKFSQESYRSALADIAQQHPALWRAYQDGFLHDGDFSTLALLLPSSKRGSYADDTAKKYEFSAQ